MTEKHIWENGETITADLLNGMSEYVDDEHAQVTAQLADIENTKADIADLPSSAYTFKGSTTFAALPTTGNTLGDVRYTTDNLVNYAWTGTAWTPIGNGAFANGSVVTQKLASNAVTPQKTSKGLTINKADKLLTDLKLKRNLYDLREVVDNKDISTTTVPSIAFVDSANYALTGYLAVKQGQTINASVGAFIVGFDKDKNWNNVLRQSIGTTTSYTVLQDGYIVLSFPRPAISTFAVYESTNTEIDNGFKYVFENLEVDGSQLVGDLEFKNADWTNILEDGFALKSGLWGVDNATLDFAQYPTKATINTTYLYPSITTLYRQTFKAGVSYAIYFDFTVLSANFSACKIGIRIDNSGKDFAFKTFTPSGNQKGVMIITPTQDVTLTNITFNFRDFVGVPDATNTQMVFEIDNVMTIELKGHLVGYSEDDILNNLVYREGNTTGLIKSTRSIEHSEKTAISEESKFVRTGWYGKKICTFGDSTIAQERWQPYMAKRLGCSYTNRGIGGTRIEMITPDDGHNAQSYTSDSRVATIDTDADAIVIFGGFNDISTVVSVPFDTTNNISDIANWNYNPYNMQGAISLLIKKIRAINPTAKIIIASPPFGFANISTANMHKIRKAMEEACFYNGVDYIDMYRLCQWNIDNWTAYHPEGDNIHFDALGGSEVIAGIVCDALMKYEPWD